LSSPDPTTGWGKAGAGAAAAAAAGGGSALPPVTTAGPVPQTPAPVGTRRGSLVLHLGADDNDTSGETATSHVHVEPMEGRMIIFDARTILHEVLPHDRPADRLALTVWVGGRHTTVGPFGMVKTSQLRRLRACFRAALGKLGLGSGGGGGGGGGAGGGGAGGGGKASSWPASVANIDWKQIDFV
jgi:hypothetical protein